MTNTLHRFGTAESFADDYVIIAIPAKGAKGQGDPMPALKRFLELADEHGAVNIGDAMNGGALRPTRHKHAIRHFFPRSPAPDFQKVIDGVTKPTTFAAVFDDREKAEAFTERLRQEDFGLSINISSSLENALGCCARAGIKRHSVGYSLGFEGVSDNDPNRNVLMLSTMCGHGMIAHSLARKMIDWVKEGRATPDQAVAALGRFCSCGIFNPSRARRILEDARTKTF
jgi:hypothetical protein